MKYTYLKVLFLVVAIVCDIEGSVEPNAKDAQKGTEKGECVAKEESVVTHHQMNLNGKLLDYQAVAGTLILKDEACKATASLFYISYTKEGVESTANRPITFCFNGGPGSCSVWLNLGVLGPKKVFIHDDGKIMPPYHLVENEFSLLDETDLVFIDPVSTGFSRAIPQEEAKNFHGVEKDIKSVAEFIHLYLTQNQRWDSPKFIIGESYGTVRASGLADYLHEKHYISVNGLVLISTVLNFQTICVDSGNDLPYQLFLPSYTAAAWYHKKLGSDLQGSFADAIAASVAFATNDYGPALFKGDLLSTSERSEVIAGLARLTGLSAEYIDLSDLRVHPFYFMKELLRDKQQTIGRFDARIKGLDRNVMGEEADYDPSKDAIIGVFTATMNHYLKTDLNWNAEATYKVLTSINPWDYGKDNRYFNISDTLKSVMTKNPYLRVFVGSGYYDLATPYFATEYTFNHLGLHSSLRSHVKLKNYEGGHMMYLNFPSLKELKGDLASFYQETLRAQSIEEKAAPAIQR